MLFMTTPTINIEVVTRFLADASKPDKQRFAFAYTVTISNEGEQAAQLLNRHWIITDANNAVQEVKGAGVVGEQPRILPSKSYTYTSGSVLRTDVGTMEGSFEMQTDDGEKFIVPIPVFSLLRPQALH